MKKNTVYSVVMVAMLFAVSLFFVGGTYARYVSSFEGENTVDVAKWAVKLNDGNEDTSLDLNLTADGNTDVVNGKIAPAVTLSDDVEISLNGTEVSVDIIVDATEEDIATALQEAGITGVTKDDIKLTVEKAKGETATFDDLTGDGTKDSPIVVKLKDTASGFGENDKLTITVKVTWENTEAHNTDHTDVGSKAGTEVTSITIPVKLHVVQHINGSQYNPE